MKNFFVLLAIVSATLSSCIEGDTIVEGAAVRTDYITVHPNQWLDNKAPGTPGHYIYATVNLPVISQYMLESGLVIAYYLEQQDNVLPYTRPYVYTDGFLYTETIRFDVEVGKITFIIEASDFSSPDNIDYNMKFKVITIAN